MVNEPERVEIGESGGDRRSDEDEDGVIVMVEGDREEKMELLVTMLSDGGEACWGGGHR